MYNNRNSLPAPTVCVMIMHRFTNAEVLGILNTIRQFGLRLCRRHRRRASGLSQSFALKLV